MIEQVFVDTGAFFALKCSSDKRHDEAVALYNSLVSNPVYSLVTTNLVLFETATLMKARLGASHAVELAASLRKSSFIRYVKVSDEIENEAWNIFEKYADKEFSFVDCASFAFMKQEGITKAFAFDKHFSQFGFQLLR